MIVDGANEKICWHSVLTAHKSPFFCSSSDNTAHVWKLTKKGAKCIRTATGHAHSVVTLGFGPGELLPR